MGAGGEARCHGGPGELGVSVEDVVDWCVAGGVVVEV